MVDVTLAGEWASPSEGRRTVDGLVMGGREVWLVVGRPSECSVEELLAREPRDPGEPLPLCRAVLEGGVLVVGAPTAEEDALLSAVLEDLAGGRPC